MGVSPAARAGDPDDPKLAARHFAEAERAYKAADWTHAALSFEAAYRAAPHPDPLWNAARAWHRAGELARAANLYDKYLREAPGDARDRAQAQRARSQLARSLARIDVYAGAGFDDLRVDGKSFEGEGVWVVAGDHVVSGRQGERVIEQKATVGAGSIRSVTLANPEPASPASAAAPVPVATSSPAPPPAAPAPRHGWSRTVVYVGGGATLAASGILLWSGLDTRAARAAYDRAPTKEKRDAGSTKELRTNIVLGAVVGLGAFTALAALFFVDWHPHDVQIALAPTQVTLGGVF